MDHSRVLSTISQAKPTLCETVVTMADRDQRKYDFSMLFWNIFRHSIVFQHSAHVGNRIDITIEKDFDFLELGEKAKHFTNSNLKKQFRLIISGFRIRFFQIPNCNRNIGDWYCLR